MRAFFTSSLFVLLMLLLLLLLHLPLLLLLLLILLLLPLLPLSAPKEGEEDAVSFWSWKGQSGGLEEREREVREEEGMVAAGIGGDGRFVISSNCPFPCVYVNA